MQLLLTLETDPQSPFCDAEVPAAEWTWRTVLARNLARGPAFLRAWCAAARSPNIPEFPRRPSGRTVQAFVNHGRWMWRCPDCPEAQVASHDDRRAFCCGCFNGGGGYHEVLFPDEATFGALESLLAQRPLLASRNWTPEETLDKLQLENIALGCSSAAPGLPASRYEIALPLVRSALTEIGRAHV